MDKTRCHWFDKSNDILRKYHDEEFGILNKEDDYLFEILVLVNFQTGLSWEIMLKKREDFRIAFDGFDVEKIANYDEDKIEELLSNEKIIRYDQKIRAVINNAQVFIKIQEEYGSFYDYIKTFTNGEIIHERGLTESELSRTMVKDLKKKGMLYLGPITMYSYLQTVGVINSHEEDCFLY
jgi:DNA-3-methyladenine glycosylase I